MTMKTTNIDWITPGAQAIISDYHPDTDRHTAAPVSVLSVTGSRMNFGSRVEVIDRDANVHTYLTRMAENDEDGNSYLGSGGDEPSRWVSHNRLIYQS